MSTPVELDYQTEFYYQWHITDRCNLRCKHCYHEDYREEGLTISQLLKIAAHLSDAVKEWGKIGSFSITGGEPFTRKDAVFESYYLRQSRRLEKCEPLKAVVNHEPPQGSKAI